MVAPTSPRPPSPKTGGNEGDLIELPPQKTGADQVGDLGEESCE